MNLHGSASSPGVTVDLIDGLKPKLGKLNKDDLSSIAESIGLVGMKSKPKPQIIDAVVNRIKSIKQSSIRTSIFDRAGIPH